MEERDLVARRFEDHRDHLRGVAFRMLGSRSDAEDAVQEAWLRLHRSDTAEVTNLGGWLTTVVARVCLDMLRTRRARPDVPFDEHLPDPVISARPDAAGPDGADPEQSTLLGEAVGLALLVVLDTLAPPERIAFVLHDMFGVPFEEIAPVVDRSPAAARQLASRARRRVRGASPLPDPDRARQREVVDAFLAAARQGDLAALVAALDPGVVLRADTGAGALHVVHGADAVAAEAMAFSFRAEMTRPALVNGAHGLVAVARDRVVAVLTFTVAGGRIAGIDILADPARLSRIDPATMT